MQWILFFTVFMYFFLTPFKGVYAYLDPGTGSYLFQVIIAIFFGVLVALKIRWLKIKSWLGKFFNKKNHERDNTF